LLIVYPDADPQIKSLLNDEMLAEITSLAEFRIFEGRPGNQEEFLARVEQADGLLLGWDIPNQVIAACPNLKIISFTGIGYKNFIDAEFARQRGIAVTNTPGYADNAVAEHALALLLAVAKNIQRNHINLRQGLWDQTMQSLELRGKTIGIIGTGGIGLRMATICEAIGMKVICWTRNRSEERSRKLGVRFVELDELLQEADVISLHLPFTDETKGVLGDRELSMMKRGAILINTSRAELIDTPSLVERLASGQLAGAGIDVFDQEPVSPDNPYLKLDNVVLSPHVGFNTEEATRKILEISVDNLVQFFRGNPQNIVNAN